MEKFLFNSYGNWCRPTCIYFIFPAQRKLLLDRMLLLSWTELPKRKSLQHPQLTEGHHQLVMKTWAILHLKLKICFPSVNIIRVERLWSVFLRMDKSGKTRLNTKWYVKGCEIEGKTGFNWFYFPSKLKLQLEAWSQPITFLQTFVYGASFPVLLAYHSTKPLCLDVHSLAQPVLEGNLLFIKKLRGVVRLL